jgi:hypothetical protein
MGSAEAVLVENATRAAATRKTRESAFTIGQSPVKAG